MEDIAESFEGLHFTFTKVPMGDMREYLLSREGDIAVSLHLSVLDSEEITLVELFPIESFILMSQSHPLAQKDCLDKNDLINETVYLSEPLDCYSFMNDMFGGLSLKKERVVSVPSIETALLNIRYAGGVTSANNMMHASSHDKVYKKFPLLDDTYVPKVAMAWNRDTVNPVVPFFRDLAKAHFLK